MATGPDRADEWPYYCATFHLAVRWYADHPSDEMFFFLIAMQPGWPYFSSDPGNWPEWVKSAEAAVGDRAQEDLPYGKHYLLASAYVGQWGDLDTSSRPGVRELAEAMRAHDATGHELRSQWIQHVTRTVAHLEGMGVPFTIKEPPPLKGA